jgi:hypothetical protein
MNKRKICQAFALVLTVCGFAFGQEPCSAKLASLPQVPELFGFHLGMTAAEVKARVPKIAIPKADSVGLTKTSISPGFDPNMDNATFPDVRTVSLDFLDGHVMQLWIGFDHTFKWKTVEEFVKGISQALSIPATWTAKGRGQQIQCADFSLLVTAIGGGPSLRIVDSAADNLLAARRQAKADEAEVAENGTPDESVVGDSKTKTYYPADCQGLNGVAENTRVKFDTPAAAEKAGYKRTKDCQ